MTPPQPRRRPAASELSSDASTAAALPKLATFHSPTNPANANDPQLNVMGYPRRAPTSPQALDQMLADVNAKVDQLGLNDTVAQSRDERSPNPAFAAKHAAQHAQPSKSASRPDPFDINNRADRVAARSNSDHSHDSDSGIGSSVSADESAPSSPEIKTRSVKPGEAQVLRADTAVANVGSVFEAARKSNKSVYTPSAAAFDPAIPHTLSKFALDKIDILVFRPLLAHGRLQKFHSLVDNVREKVGKGTLICLRDVEKSLIMQAPAKSASPSSYLVFAETAVQCVHTTMQHLSGRDLSRPTDKPYSNTYFVDLIEQIRQYARIMEAHRLSRQLQGNKDKAKAMSVELDESGLNAMGERIRLEGGISKNGEPLRLVREDAQGKVTEIDAQKQDLPEELEADGERSMARKRKCDIGKIDIKTCRECGKEFTRSCDLTKHEKTHSRPWKCPEATCDYSQSGFATEKECERHYNDKHDPDPKMYSCLFSGCNYLSKRESNCKQHMEKTHGWNYERSKSKKDQPIVIPMFRQSELKQMMNTPKSMAQSVATPSSSHLSSSSVATPASTHLTYSPAISSNAISPITVPDTNMANDVNIFDHSLMGDNFSEPYEDGSFDFQNFGNGLGMARSVSLEEMMSPDSDYGMLTTGSNLMGASTGGFDANAMLWPPADDFFESYNMAPILQPQPTQQPTPAYSDHQDFSGCDFAGPQTLQKPSDVLTPVSEGRDFEMYGQAPPSNHEQQPQQQPSSHAESSAMGGNLFPELGNVGLQFDPMFNSMTESVDSVDFSNFVHQSQE